MKGLLSARKDRYPSGHVRVEVISVISPRAFFCFLISLSPGTSSLIHDEAFSASEILDKTACSFLASPGVSCMGPSDVTKRYVGIGWYVSGRIYGCNQSRVVPPKNVTVRIPRCLPLELFQWYHLDPRFGWELVCCVGLSMQKNYMNCFGPKVRHTVNMHPALVCLHSHCFLRFINTLCEPILDRRV